MRISLSSNGTSEQEQMPKIDILEKASLKEEASQNTKELYSDITKIIKNDKTVFDEENREKPETPEHPKQHFTEKLKNSELLSMKMNKIIVGTSIVACSALILSSTLFIANAASETPEKTPNPADAVQFTTEIKDFDFPAPEGLEGRADLASYMSELLDVRHSSANLKQSVEDEWGTWLTDEQRNALQEAQDGVSNAMTFAEADSFFAMKDEIVSQCAAAKEEAERIEAERKAEEEKKAAEAAARAKASSGGNYANSGSGHLTKSGGVFYFNGHRETYYSQRVLPGGGLNIPGRHVDPNDGTIRDGDGYICVASSDYPRGTIVETSLGTGKVYDSGCDSGTIDIYTDW